MPILTRCAVCGEPTAADWHAILRGDWQRCERCRAAQTPPALAPCPGCGRPMVEGERVCLECARRKPGRLGRANDDDAGAPVRPVLQILQVSVGGEMVYTPAAIARRRCTAIRKDSEPCHAWAVWGDPRQRDLFGMDKEPEAVHSPDSMVTSVSTYAMRRWLVDHTRPDLPPFPRVLFRKAPLVQVLGQVRFPALPAFSEPSYIEKLRRELRWEYPKSSKTEQLSLTLSPKHAEHFPGPTLWRFSSLDDGWSAVLAEDALTLEVRGYTSIEEFVERFERVLVAIEKVLEPPLRTRVGLRYINEFRYPGVKTIADWRPLIRPEVLGLAATADDIFGGGVVVPTRQDVHVNLPDGTLVIRHGLLTGTTVEPASGDDVPREPFYLLDMDYFNIKTEELDRQVVGELFRRYNDTMYRFFRWVMLGPLYDSLEPGHDG